MFEKQHALECTVENKVPIPLRKPSQGYASQNIVGGWRTRINSLSASNGGRVGARCRCCNLALDPALNAFPTPSTRYDTLGHGEFISRSGDGRGAKGAIAAISGVERCLAPKKTTV